MTLSSFLLASALSVGAFPPVVQTNHATPAPAPASAPSVAAPLASATPPAPVASTPGQGCGTTSVVKTACGCESDCRPRLLDSLRGLFSRRAAEGCGCASAPCTPAPAPVIIHHPPKVIPVAPCRQPCDPCPQPCDPCAKPARPSFFDLFRRLRQPSGDCGCGSHTAPGGLIAPSPAPVYHGSPAPAPAPAPAPSPAPNAPEIKKLPTGAAPVIPSISPAAAKEETGSVHPFDQPRQHGQHPTATDFSKLTGKLTYVHADGGIWVLRYAGLDTEDANGGSVQLAKDRRLMHYRDGDIVSVEGRLMEEKGSLRLGAPLYQADVIQLIERTKR